MEHSLHLVKGATKVSTHFNHNDGAAIYFKSGHLREAAPVVKLPLDEVPLDQMNVAFAHNTFTAESACLIGALHQNFSLLWRGEREKKKCLS